MRAPILAPEVSEREWREHRRRIRLEIERYRRWCETVGLSWSPRADAEAKAAPRDDGA